MTRVVLEVSNRVAHVVLDRVEQRNALDDELTGELDDVLRTVGADTAVECVVVRGAGPGFSAGIDAETLPELGTPDTLRRIRGAFVTAFERLETMPKPTVAEVHGFAIGAGFELALACDLRVIAADAKLGLPETRMGIVPGVGGCARLASLVGVGRAKELIMTSAIFSGVRAAELGIANRVAAQDRLPEETARLVDQLRACSVLANGLAKRVIDLAPKPAHEQALAAELDAQLDCVESDRFREAAGKFLAAPGANLGRREQ